MLEIVLDQLPLAEDLLAAGMRCIVHQVNVARESYGGLMLQVADWNDVIYNIVSHCANQMDCKYIA